MSRFAHFYPDDYASRFERMVDAADFERKRQAEEKLLRSREDEPEQRELREVGE